MNNKILKSSAIQYTCIFIIKTAFIGIVNAMINKEYTYVKRKYIIRYVHKSIDSLSRSYFMLFIKYSKSLNNLS